MSIQAVAWVLEHSPTKGSDRLVLLSIANHVNDAWEAWPSKATIQREANVNRPQTVDEALGRLVRDGHLDRVVNGAPDSRTKRGQRPNLYRVRRPSPPDGDPALAPSPDNGVAPTPENGARTISEPSVTVETPSVSPPAQPHIVALCDDLADSIAAHREGPKPKVTARWLRDMRLLVERGPLHVEDPKPIEPHRVATAIRFVFTELAEPTGRDGFCWADQIRSAHALRDHWEQLADAARRLVRQRRRDPLAPARPTSTDPLAGPPLRLGAP